MSIQRIIKNAIKLIDASTKVNERHDLWTEQVPERIVPFLKKLSSEIEEQAHLEIKVEDFSGSGFVRFCLPKIDPGVIVGGLRIEEEGGILEIKLSPSGGVIINFYQPCLSEGTQYRYEKEEYVDISVLTEEVLYEIVADFFEDTVKNSELSN